MPNAEIFEINYVELPKLPKNVGSDMFELWLKFLDAKSEEDLKMLIAKEPKVFGVAVNKLRKLSASEEIRERMRKEEKARMDRVSALAKSKREGIKEGKIEDAIAMKAEGIKDDVIARVTKLSIDEIKKL